MEISYHAAGRAEMLKHRADRCVCRRCGSALRLKRINFSEFDDARVELFCEHCDRIEFGVEPEIYQCARYFVETLLEDEQQEQNDDQMAGRLTVAKVCDIMAWGCKNMNLMDANGFRVPVAVEEALMNQCNILTAEDVARLAGEEDCDE